MNVLIVDGHLSGRRTYAVTCKRYTKEKVNASVVVAGDPWESAILKITKRGLYVNAHPSKSAAFHDLP